MDFECYFNQMFFSKRKEMWDPLQEIYPHPLTVNLANLESLIHELIIIKKRNNFFQCFKTLFTKQKEQFNYLTSIYYYIIKVQKGGSKLVFGVHQEDDNNVGVKETRPNIPIGVIVLKENSDKTYEITHYEKQKNTRDIFIELSLDEGNYLFVPFSLFL